MGNLLNIVQKRRLAILNEVPAIMHLSYDYTTELNLLIETQSGDDWEIDWGDGVWERYASSVSTYRTKTFSSSTSGVARARSATGRGLSDILRMRSSVGTWSFDATALLRLTSLDDLVLSGNGFTGNMEGVSELTSLAYLYLNSQGFTGNMTGVVGLDNLTYLRLIGNGFTGEMTGVSGLDKLTSLHLVSQGFTGNMTGVDQLDQLTYLYLNSQGFTGDMTGVPSLDKLTYLYLVGNFIINYMPTTWAPSYQFFLFRPTTTTNPMGTDEIDQALIDAAATTWTGSRIIYIDGNNGVRSSASDAAVAALQAMEVTLYLNV